MTGVDQRGELEAEPFSYRASKDGVVFLEFHGRVVKTIRGDQARKFLAQIEGLTGLQAQLVMAKITGNFKRGNERNSKSR